MQGIIPSFQLRHPNESVPLSLLLVPAEAGEDARRVSPIFFFCPPTKKSLAAATVLYVNTRAGTWWNIFVYKVLCGRDCCGQWPEETTTTSGNNDEYVDACGPLGHHEYSTEKSRPWRHFLAQRQEDTG